MGTGPSIPAPTAGRSSALRKGFVKPTGPGQVKNHSAKSEVGKRKKVLFLQFTLGFSLSLIKVVATNVVGVCIVSSFFD